MHASENSERKQTIQPLIENKAPDIKLANAKRLLNNKLGFKEKLSLFKYNNIEQNV